MLMHKQGWSAQLICSKLESGQSFEMCYLYLTTHNWQNWRVFLTCPCHETYRDEEVGLKKSQIYLKNYDLCEYVEFGAIMWKFDVLSITA